MIATLDGLFMFSCQEYHELRIINSMLHLQRDDIVKMIVISITLSLAMVGCQPSIIQDTNSLTPTQAVDETQTVSALATKPVETSEILAQQSAPTPMPSSTLTSTPILTNTPVPTATTTVILSPTATNSPPLSTLSPEEATNQVMALLEDSRNPECLLPCWWGATPGITYWQEIEPFLRTFSSVDRSSSNGISIKLPLAEEISRPGFEYNQVYTWDELGKITSITVDSINIAGYDAKTMVSLYGLPDEIWIRTMSSPREGVLPFQLVITYQQMGFSLYYYVDAAINDSVVTSCFEPGFVEVENPNLFPAGPRIYAWEAGEDKSIEEVVREPLATFFLLQDKTDLTPETLHAKFTNPDEQPCIDTPAELWREIG